MRLTDSILNSAAVLSVGTTQLRQVFTAAQLPEILDAYVIGIQSAFVMAVATDDIAVFIGIAHPWFRMNKPGISGSAAAI